MNSKSTIPITIILLLYLVSTGFTQGNWELILPTYPTSNHLVSVYFIDDQTGWAVGQYGTIVKTIDGGDTWSLTEIPWMDWLLDVHFSSATIGYAVGENANIIKSSDGGESWEKLEVKYTNNLNRVKFRDEDRGWIIGEKGLILYTSDGGANWQQQVSNTPENLTGIDFINDPSLCIVGANSTILSSSDNGENWNPYISNIDCNLNDVFFTNDTLGWIGGEKESSSGIILKTTDGGKSWEEEIKSEIIEMTYSYKEEYGGSRKSRNPPGSFKYNIQQILFKDLQNGLCLLHGSSHDYKMNNIPLYTLDGGEGWNCIMQGKYEGNNQPGRFCFLSDDKIINTDFGGEFRYSYDGGLTWTYPNHSMRIIQKIIPGNNGRLLAYRKLTNQFTESITTDYLYSNDFGRTWQSFTPQVFDSTGKEIDYLNVGMRLPDSYIDDGETLWIIGAYKQIFESKDFGLTWHCVRTGLNEYPSVERFVTSDTLIYGHLRYEPDSNKNWSYVLKFNYSFDGGRTVVSNQFHNLWNIITISSSHTRLHDICFVNGRTGFLVGSDGNILRTTDTGQNWESIHSNVIEDLFDIEFTSQSVGFVVGKFGRILKTEDCGKTWRKTDSGTQENIYCIGFKNENQGWAGTSSGLRYTTDGGETWRGVPSRYQHGVVQYVKFDKYGNGYAYTPSPFSGNRRYGIDEEIPGGYNFLLCMKNEDVSVEYENDGSMVPKSLELYANYPNPFNPCTNIAFDLPKSGSVCLRIYNIQGQLIRTLVDSKQTGGEHTVSWDGFSDQGTMVTSGVYVCRIESENKFKTRKMLLLR